MNIQAHPLGAMLAVSFFVPFTLFAGFIAWLVVPAVIDAVVPAVVTAVVDAVAGR